MRCTRTKFWGFFISLLLMLLVSGCEKRPEGLLSSDKMTDFLFDLHKLDGCLSANALGSGDTRENVYYYNALLQKHNITKAQFDSSVVWYTAHPKSYDKIYVNVYERLTQFNTDVFAGKFHPVDSVKLRNSLREIWPLKANFLITPDAAVSELPFLVNDSQLRWNDQYTLRFLLQLSAPDTAVSKQIVFRIRYAGDISDSIIVPLLHDSVLRRYTLRLKARRQLPIDNISGELLSDSSKATKFYAKIDSISLTRHFDALAQDSIKTLIEQIQQEAVVSSVVLLDTTMSEESVELSPIQPKAVVPKSTEIVPIKRNTTQPDFFKFISLKPAFVVPEAVDAVAVDSLKIDTITIEPKLEKPMLKMEKVRRTSKIQIQDETSR